MSPPPKVFISYSHDSPAHAERVLQLADSLRTHGIDATIDQYDPSPSNGWPRWMEQHAEQSDYVLMIMTEIYRRRFDGNEDPGKGRGVAWEGNLIRNELYENVFDNKKFIPVFFTPADRQYIPSAFKSYTSYTLNEFTLADQGYESLLRHLSNQPLITKPPLGQLPNLPPRQPQTLSPSELTKPHRPNNLPFSSLESLFKGRKDTLTQLNKLLKSGSKKTVVAARTIHGLGGVGKTRLAVEYAWKHINKLSAALFVVADSPESLSRNLADFTSPNKLDLKDAHEALEQQVRVDAVLNWLRTNSNWLLILDNVDTDDSKTEVQNLIKHLTTGQIIITSRIANWDRGIQTMELDILDPKDGRDYLLERTDGRRAHSNDDPDQALSIAQDVDGLALALEQIASYISELRISFSAYHQRWEKKRQEILNQNVSDHDKPIWTTYQTTIDQLSSPAQKLLNHLAWLSPEPIPTFLFEGEKTEPAWNALIEGDIFQARAELLKYSLLKHDTSTQPSNFLIHRLVQEITRQSMPPEEQKNSLKESLHILDTGHPGHAQDVHTWPHWEPLAPHYLMATHLADDRRIYDPTSRLMNNLAQLFNAKSQYKDAEPLMRRALAIDEASFGKDHSNVARDLTNLAKLLHTTNRLREAEPLMRRALKIDESALGKDHPNVAVHLSNLAMLCATTNRFSEAEPLLRRALEISETVLGKQHPSVAIYLNNLVQLLHDTNRFSEIDSLIRRSLAINEAAYGKNHPSVAKDLNNLAKLFSATNRFSEAEQLLQRVVDIFEAIYCQDHPYIATAINNLAQVTQATNRFSEAEPLMHRALKIDQAVFGDEHPIISRDLNNIARLYEAMNRLSEAEPLMQRSLEILIHFSKSTGCQHSHTQAVLGNYIGLLKTMQFPDQEIESRILSLLQ